MDKREQEEQLIEAAVRLQNDLYDSGNEFNDFLDTDEWPTVYAPSKTLFWLDRFAYDDQKRAFENDKIVASHEDAIALLKNDPEQKQVFLNITEAVRRQRIVPFIGAGLSKALDKDLPLWGEALEQMRKARSRFNKSAEFDALMRDGKYLDAAELLQANNKPQTEGFIRNRYNVTDKQGFELKGGVQLLPSLCGGCIVTTNFDNAIEQAFRKVNNPFESYMQGPVPNKFFPALAKGERCLLKLHGDAADNETYVFTKRQYERHYRRDGEFDFTKPLPKALRQIYVSNSLLFIGCGLEKDWTFELFQSVRNTRQYEVPMHYALVEKPATNTARSRKHDVLINFGITPIWYPHKGYQYVEKLLKLIIDVADNRLSL